MTARSTPRTNQLLAALPDEVWLRWAPMLEPVELMLGEVLYEAGDTMAFVYFPITAIVSLLYETRDGESAETALATRASLAFRCSWAVYRRWTAPSCKVQGMPFGSSPKP